jgi:hypothetical protein
MYMHYGAYNMYMHYRAYNMYMHHGVYNMYMHYGVFNMYMHYGVYNMYMHYGVYNMYMELEVIFESSMQGNMHPRDIIVDKMHHRCTFWDRIFYKDTFGDITRSLDRFPVYSVRAHLETEFRVGANSVAECALAAHFGDRMCRSGTFSSKGASRVLGQERERKREERLSSKETP